MQRCNVLQPALVAKEWGEVRSRTAGRRHLPLFLNRGGELNPELAVNCNTIREFDDAVTRVAFGAPQQLPGTRSRCCSLAPCATCGTGPFTV